MKIEESDLKELLEIFKTEQDYAERKNQIIFIILGIFATIFATVVDKFSTIQLWVLVSAFLFIGFLTLCSFFPQGKIINWFSKIVFKLLEILQFMMDF